MLTRNNSKQLSCILLIMHTGTINFSKYIMNFFFRVREWRVVRRNMSFNHITPDSNSSTTEVWLYTSSISHLLIFFSFFFFGFDGKKFTWFLCKQKLGARNSYFIAFHCSLSFYFFFMNQFKWFVAFDWNSVSVKYKTNFAKARKYGTRARRKVAHIFTTTKKNL